MGNQPEKKFKAGSVTATVWKNEQKTDKGETYEYMTVSLERSYQDKEGNWQSTNSLRNTDVPKAQLVLSEAFKFISLKE